ncbi:hypothetical protein PP182_04945 [Maribacter sp. PR1]|uniref:Phenylalanyl-tRNA synthetase subunit alpha n=1 Tax=Maribacter cobaltidurans TaxID=1178778 RepID=A0ABU7IR06_9FLAO|nr:MULTISPECIES: hypothetical protein [Maribacter]MDC6388014.1 hypothetical protein [Maribacter sp. PR1]MEE1975402.1 hypothetical protein [Maribacter cobaltidurans]
MKKDIEIPIAKDVYIALIHEWNDEFLSKDWNAYIINNRTTPIEMAIIVSKGYDDEVKTSTMRHAIGLIGAKTFEKVELVQEEVLRLNNEFFVTYYADNKLYEKRFVFEKGTVSEQNLINIPLIEKDGIFAK